VSIPIKILAQVADNEPQVIGTAELDPATLQADLENVFIELVRFVRANPMPQVVADVLD